MAMFQNDKPAGDIPTERNNSFGSIEVTLKPTPEMFQTLEGIVDRAELAINMAQSAIDIAKNMLGDNSLTYQKLSDEISALRAEFRVESHRLGNAINGKVGAYEAEVFIRQIVVEELNNRMK